MKGNDTVSHAAANFVFGDAQNWAYRRMEGHSEQGLALHNWNLKLFYTI
jgi:hypothetical protein